MRRLSIILCLAIVGCEMPAAPPTSSPAAPPTSPAPRRREVLCFSAKWCGSCRQFAPTFAAWSKRYPDISFRIVDVDADPQAAQQYKVTAMPTVVVTVNGVEVKRWTGAPTEAELLAVIR